MTVQDDLAKVREQEAALVFDRFDEAEAFALGTRLRDMALAAGHPIIIDIRLWDRPLFYAALPGSTGGNTEWARRKINSVRLYQKSTYRMWLEQGADKFVFGPRFGHPGEDYVIAGGAFPIRVKGMGAVGAVAISGLAQRDDHDVVANALIAHLGLDEAGLALPAEAS